MMYSCLHSIYSLMHTGKNTEWRQLYQFTTAYEVADASIASVQKVISAAKLLGAIIFIISIIKNMFFIQ